MRGRLSKVSVLFLALVLALGGIGAAFASWTDTLTISGTVETGDLDLFVYYWDNDDPYGPGFDVSASWEPYPDPGPENYNYLDGHPDSHYDPAHFPVVYPDPDGKNVGWTEVTPLDEDMNPVEPDAPSLNVENLAVDLYNVYPCYFNSITLYPQNKGSIPARIAGAIVRWTEGVTEHFEVLTSGGTILMDFQDNGTDDLLLMWGDGYGAQMHQGEYSLWPEVSFSIHVLQDEGEGVQLQTFGFTIELVGVQWNEWGSYTLTP